MSYTNKSYTNNCGLQDLFEGKDKSAPPKKKSEANSTGTISTLTSHLQNPSSPPTASQPTPKHVRDEIMANVSKKESNFFSPATAEGEERRPCQVDGCPRRADTAPRPEDSRREKGLHPNTHCKHHAGKVGRNNFMQRPCFNQCGNDLKDNKAATQSRKYCDTCVAVCTCCKEEDSVPPSPYCTTCVSEHKVGKGVDCRDCSNVGLWRDSPVCETCFKRKRAAECTRCKQTKEGFFELGSQRCTRLDCKGKCIFVNRQGKLCSNEAREGNCSNGRKMTMCDVHCYPTSGKCKREFREEAREVAKAKREVKVWYQCTKHLCGFYDQSTAKFGKGSTGKLRCFGPVCNAAVLGVFCAALAKRGYVVAAVHHTDGSSARVPLADGTCRFYEHLPTGEDYSPQHRLEQVHHRAREYLYCCSWLVGDGGSVEEGHHPILDQIRPHLDEKKLIAAGFSYGSTTVSLAATLQPDKFQCAVLLDPWLHIDYRSKGVEFDFPPEAFGAGWPAWPPPSEADASITDDETKGLDVPSLLLYSSQFEGYTELFNAGQRLADRINARSKKKRAEVHVIGGTAHQNFCDVIFWLPRRLSRKMFGLGESDAYESYEAILDWTVRFLERF